MRRSGDFVRDFFDKIDQKVSRLGFTVLFKKCSGDKRACAINGDKKGEFPFLRAPFSTIDMKITSGLSPSIYGKRLLSWR